MSLLTLLVASILGSPHCAGMCGGFALFCSGTDTKRATPSFAYNFGRLVTYSALGLIAGTIGGTVSTGLAQFGIGNFLAIFVGLLLVAWGAGHLLGFAKLPQNFKEKRLFKLYQRAAKPVMEFRPVPRALVIGLLSTLLPCGWLYAFVAIAAASGTPWGGVTTMAVFWLGTLPMLLTIGHFSRTILHRWGSQIPAVTASLLIASGLFCIMSHVRVAGAHNHQHMTTPATTQTTDMPPMHHCGGE